MGFYGTEEWASSHCWCARLLLKKGWKDFHIFQLLDGRLFLYSKVSPLFTALLFNFQGNYCRYIHADVCKQKTAQKLKVHFGWHIEVSLGLGLKKPFLHLLGRSALPCPIAPLAYNMLYVYTLPRCILNLVILLRQSSPCPGLVYHLPTFGPYQFSDQ